MEVNNHVERQQIQLPNSLKKRIIETVLDGNRLTIIIGGTGCGKSTLVPQLLLDHVGHPILCTQPRRLAVVAVSDHVAKKRNATLGEEVGYHVGQNRVATNKTKLLFATAGILLEELKSNGLEAICKYKVVLIDECHERSAESDLCLVIIRSCMIKYPHADIRIILMSATFNQEKYTSYFRGVPGCDFIKTITLETAASIDAFYNQVQTYYLNDVLNKMHIGTRREYLERFEKRMILDPNSEMLGQDGGKSLSLEMLMVICNLVLSVHQEEPLNAKFLIFAPTYRHLEQIHSQLIDIPLKNASPLVDVLHSSIDIEDCIAKMQSNNSTMGTNRQRHILLASAIADSSVTIPGVTCVIDTCRALEVKWNAKSEVHQAKTVWASQSICDQRRGRTGRTCAGRVFRLVNQRFYNNYFNKWDQPQITLASCREEILVLLSSTNKILSNPQGLLEKCLDPPPSTSVAQAIKYLQRIGACEVTMVGKKVKLRPTDLGRLIAALPCQCSDANMIIQGAKSGVLYEALVMTAIKSTRPYPILHIFGESERNESIQKFFFRDTNPKDPKSVAIANFSAYLFWVVNWKKKILQKKGKDRFLHCTNSYRPSTGPQYAYSLYPDEVEDNEKLAPDCNVWQWSSQMVNAHSEFCKKYYINPTSVRAIDASVNVSLNTLYHKDYEPDWLQNQPSITEWSKHIHSNDVSLGQDILGNVYGYQRGKEIYEILIQLQDPSAIVSSSVYCPKVQEKTACIHFLNGNCTFGDRCRNAHSYTALRPVCRFFLNGGCSKSDCPFSHSYNQESNDVTIKKLSIDSLRPDGGSFEWFKSKAEKLLLFGEGDFSFTRALVSQNIYPSYATTVNKQSSISSRTEKCTILTGVDATRCHKNEHLMAAAKHITTCAWNFPYTGNDENNEIHISLLSGAFLSAASFLETNLKHVHGQDAEFALALQGDQLSRWCVLQSAQNAGFDLLWWEEFDNLLFPNYLPKRSDGECFPAQHARFYVFRLSIGKEEMTVDNNSCDHGNDGVYYGDCSYDDEYCDDYSDNCGDDSDNYDDSYGE